MRSSLEGDTIYNMSGASPAPATNPLKSASVRIERGMRVSDILALLPHAGPLIAQYGLSCFGCSANTTESLEEGCRSHGMPEAEIDDLITDLNELLKHRPVRPETLEITESAAQALKQVMEGENKVGWGLGVGLDEAGGFCMELREKASADEKIFMNKAVPDVQLFASAFTLGTIGGATIDFRDGRFKLDLPEDAAKKECGCGGNCACEGGGECGCGDKE